LAHLVLKNPRTGEEVAVELRPGATYFIGRLPNALDHQVYLFSEDGRVKIPLFGWEDNSVSRKHLEVTVTGNLEVFVRDHGAEGAGSTRGTYVLKGGRVARLMPIEWYELAPGDALFLGGRIYLDGVYESGPVAIYVKGVNGKERELDEAEREKLASRWFHLEEAATKARRKKAVPIRLRDPLTG